MLEYLNNNSVAAFIGAFSAFMLVALTDMRRRRKMRSLLRILISDNLDHARHKVESVRMNRALLQEDNRIVDAPIMRFPVTSIRDIQHQVLDLLSANEKQATDALVYWMEAIDDLVAQGVATAKKMKSAIRDNASLEAKTQIGSEYVEIMTDAERNLELLVRLCDSYVQGRFHEIIEFSHPVTAREQK